MSDDTHAEAVQERFARTAARVAERERSRREQLRESCGSSSRWPATSGYSTRAEARGRSRSRWRRSSARSSRSTSSPSCSTSAAQAAEAGFGNVRFVEGRRHARCRSSGTPSTWPPATGRCTTSRARARRLRAGAGDAHRRPGLVIDQIAPADPLAALELDRFERARDPSHTRLLPDTDIRSLLDANGLVLARHAPSTGAPRPRRYLDLAGCEGEAREAALALRRRGSSPRSAGISRPSRCRDA